MYQQNKMMFGVTIKQIIDIHVMWLTNRKKAQHFYIKLAFKYNTFRSHIIPLDLYVTSEGKSSGIAINCQVISPI